MMQAVKSVDCDEQAVGVGLVFGAKDRGTRFCNNFAEQQSPS